MNNPQLDLELAVMAIDGERPEPDPPEITVGITSPVPGAVLNGSRDGNPDVIKLDTIAFKCTVTSVTLVVEQPGMAMRRIPTTVVGGVWIAPVQFLKSGPAVLKGEATGKTAKGMLGADSVPVNVTVAANQRQPIQAFLIDQGREVDARLGPQFPLSEAGQEYGIKVITPSPTSAVDIRTSIDNYTNPVRLTRTNTSTPWMGKLWVPGNLAPRGLRFLAQDIDYFGKLTDTDFGFGTLDNTPPRINIAKPGEDQVFLVENDPSPAAPFKVLVQGTISDPQSGYASLEYSFGTQNNVPVQIINGAWWFEIPITSYGFYELRMSARDQSGNLQLALRQFSVSRINKPQSIEELLGPGAYLNELLRFSRSHLLTGSAAAVNADILIDTFHQSFGALAQPGASEGERLVSDLLLPVRVLRDANSAETAGLIGRWSFPRRGGVELFDDFGRFQGLNGALAKSVKYGTPGTELEGAIVLDGTGSVQIKDGGPTGSAPMLKVGDDNRDFSVSIWIRPSDRRGSTYRTVIYKGHENNWPSDVNRTFAMWLVPESNRVWFRISVSNNIDAGGRSQAELAVGEWSHVAYVKAGSSLRLFINGRLDSEVGLPGHVLSNNDPLRIGNGFPAPTAGGGFIGGLGELRIYGFALSAEDIRQLALDRRAGLPGAPVANYHQVAYEALLIGLGTSFEELRSIRSMSQSKRDALATRLGMSIPGGVGDNLEVLLPPTIFPVGSNQFEEWLEGSFGLPLTYTPKPPQTALLGTPTLWAQRQAYQSYQWSIEDQSDQTTPDLDPDLIDRAELSTKLPEWEALRQRRGAELRVKFESFLTTPTMKDAMLLVFSPDEIRRLSELKQIEESGNSITDELAKLGIDQTMFRRLLSDVDLNPPYSQSEREDLAHLLTQVWKVRTRYAAWRQEETAMPSRLWPSAGSDGGWVPGYYKREFLPWRGDTQRRLELEARLTSRRQTWRSLYDGHVRMVEEAQRVALPILRDGLLGLIDLPSAMQRMDDLTERWLVDLAATGATQITAIDQATLTLQTLINGVRNKRYGVDHPARGWVIKPAYESAFDAEWQWLASYDSWRAAVMNYLYPENALFPELRKDNTPQFLAFLAGLRNIRPVTADKLPAPPASLPAGALKTAYDGLQKDEKSYFAPIAFALALQRARLYTAAMDWYRQVYDVSKPARAHKLADLLKSEVDSLRPAPNFSADDQWTQALSDPHKVAGLKDAQGRRFWGNPYTRFTLLQILHCVLSLADSEFASGTRDSRARALALYLEAKDILGFEELRDLLPEKDEQVYLPNAVVAAHRAHVDASLRKLRRGLSFTGAPLPPDITRGSGGGARSNLVRPTPYRFKLLMERAKQLAAMAQQIESQYISAIERGEGEIEKLMEKGFAQEIAGQTVALRAKQEQEAADSRTLAVLQKSRTRIEADGYKARLAAGLNEHERTQIDMLWKAKTARDTIAALDASITIGQHAEGLTTISGLLNTAWWTWVIAGALDAQVTARAVAQGFANDFDTKAQVNSILAAQERRAEEWRLQLDVANQDLLIGDQQIALADDRIAIASQESLIADTQLRQAQQMVAFLSNKFTNVEFYEWLQGLLAEVYAFFLRIATTTAQQAELQLAFERQEEPARIIKSDYWMAAPLPPGGSPTASTNDRRGITGSARLQQDLYDLDQQAFASEHRLLNLSQTFSLARLMPIDFDEFRRTGLMMFSTPMAWFDEGFPGHYMRLIKRVRWSISALIPPSLGIRATVTNGGLSRVVTDQPGFPTVILRQDPQSVVLTSPVASTGIFELDTQSDLLFPFEGSGADTTWLLELPPAGNPFNFDTIFDVVMTIEYTARHSSELRDRVVKQLSRQFLGDQSFSVRRDLPDAWYDLSNQTDSSMQIYLPLTARNFPPHLSDVSIQEISITVRLTDSQTAQFSARPSYRKPTRPVETVVSAQAAPAVRGTVSSRQSGALNWRSTLFAPGNIKDTANSIWQIELLDADGATAPLSNAFRDGRVDDVLVTFTFSGLTPEWR